MRDKVSRHGMAENDNGHRGTSKDIAVAIGIDRERFMSTLSVLTSTPASTSTPTIDIVSRILTLLLHVSPVRHESSAPEGRSSRP